MVFPLFWFGPISFYQSIFQAEEVVFEIHESFFKQTYRNRLEIATSQGRFSVSIPLANKSSKLTTNKILIDQTQPWKRDFIRTLSAAYNLSPFFEHYAPSLKAILQKEESNLVKFNLNCLHWTLEKLQIRIPVSLSSEFTEESKTSTLLSDKAFNKSAKKVETALSPYPQVFEDRLGFIPNLSILDLLFNEGPNTISFLR